jgi:hypothetical protein
VELECDGSVIGMISGAKSPEKKLTYSKPELAKYFFVS